MRHCDLTVSMEFDIVELGNGSTIVNGKLRLSMEFDIAELGTEASTVADEVRHYWIHSWDDRTRK